MATREGKLSKSDICQFLRLIEKSEIFWTSNHSGSSFSVRNLTSLIITEDFG